MMVIPWSRKLRMPSDLLLSLILIASTATVNVFATAISPLIQDGLLNVAPTTCPVVQDGYTYSTFPWTHNPTCVDATLPAYPSYDNKHFNVEQTFCTYTNAHFNNRRGISFVVTPEVAASISYETFDLAIGGLDSSFGESMGMWEVGDAGGKGKGFFATRDIAGIFAGESFIVETPAIFISKQLLETLSSFQAELLLGRAVEQLPERIMRQVQALAKSRGGSEVVDIVKTNGVPVTWPWVDDVPELLVVMPEVAVSATLGEMLQV